MASSLQAQLQARASRRAVSTPRLVKSRPSFLFNSRQAADLDSETVYNIGMNGFQELQQLDGRFSMFEKTLFAVSGKQPVDRAMHTVEENRIKENSVIICKRVFEN